MYVYARAAPMRISIKARNMVIPPYFYGEASFNPLAEVVARRETRSETRAFQWRGSA